MSRAFSFVLTMGLVNLFADISYEGGAALNGPFLAQLGLGAGAIAIAAGAGETFGYGVRSVAGWVADRTGRAWLVTFVGYAVNLLAVPAMALAHGWELAVALVFLERIGRGARKPTVEAMLSYAAKDHGRGWVFAVNNALDETGAMLGPILVALALSSHLELHRAYGSLLISSAIALGLLALARIRFPVPAKLDDEAEEGPRDEPFSRAYWLTMVGGALFGAGMTTYELVSVHLSTVEHATMGQIPLWLALGTLAAALASLALGKLYDRFGVAVVIAAVVVSAAFAPVFFFGHGLVSMIALVLLGVAYATQDALFKSLIAGVMPRGRRGAAFGVFYLGYGAGWLVGSVVSGLAYDASRPLVVAFAVTVQLASIPFFWRAAKDGSAAQPR